MIIIEYFGIDVSKGKNFIAHYTNDIFKKEFEIDHNINGFNVLLDYIKQYAGHIYYLKLYLL